MKTENISEAFLGMDTWPTEDIVNVILNGQLQAINAVQQASTAIQRAADAIVKQLKKPESRLVYVGAGSSGTILACDAAELCPTFDWPLTRLVVLRAEASNDNAIAPDGLYEDNAQEAADLIDRYQINDRDVVIGAAASGTTPYTVEAMQQAYQKNALTIGFSNNPDTPLLQYSQCPIFLDTGIEVIAGSTRMAAATALRAAVCTLSTTIMTRLGRTHDGLMVNMVADNKKLRTRAVEIIMALTPVTDKDAIAALEKTNYSIKAAVLILEQKNISLQKANQILDECHGSLRIARERL
jgi:N-acetylmuramic acid 6-phosphate etherase